MSVTVGAFATERWAIVGDVHLRYADPRAIELALAALAEIRPTGMVLNGDVLDCQGLSRFLKAPGDVDTLQGELDDFAALVKRMREVVGAVRMVFMRGNHEARLEKYLMGAAPALFGLEALTLPSLLRLDDLHVEYKPVGMPLAQGRLFVHHGARVRGFAGMSAKAELEALRYSVSSLSGHTHRLGAVYTTPPFGSEPVGAWEGGCLASLDAPYMEGRTPDWQQGFSVVEVAGNTFAVTLLPFHGHGRKRWTTWQGQRIAIS